VSRFKEAQTFDRGSDTRIFPADSLPVGADYSAFVDLFRGYDPQAYTEEPDFGRHFALSKWMSL
jgi:hypothetical protein